jgi:RNA polymerase sigma factor (sigma-70 family)
LYEHAEWSVRGRKWIGDPTDIVNDFLGGWWRKLNRTVAPTYDVFRHGRFESYIKSTFSNLIENDHKRTRRIRKKEVSLEYLAQAALHYETGSPRLEGAIQEILALLTETQQAIFKLKAEGLRSRAIANMLEITTDRVEYEIKSVRKRLRPKARTFFDK